MAVGSSFQADWFMVHSPTLVRSSESFGGTTSAFWVVGSVITTLFKTPVFDGVAEPNCVLDYVSPSFGLALYGCLLAVSLQCTSVFVCNFFASYL